MTMSNSKKDKKAFKQNRKSPKPKVQASNKI